MTIRPELSSLAVSISKIKPHPNNVRQGDIGAICQSLSEHGQYRPIVVQKKTGFILAGNHTFQAAKSLGWKEIAATFVECDEEQALRILLVDNRTNDLATYDENALAELLAQLTKTENLLDGTGYDSDDLDELLTSLKQRTSLLGDPNDLPEKVPAVSKQGDVWLLGKHRLVCGSSLDPLMYRKLLGTDQVDMVWTDPPYGVNLQECDLTQAMIRGRRKDGKGILNDDLQGDSLRQFLESAMQLMVNHAKPGAPFYVAAPAGVDGRAFTDVLADLNVYRHTLIWAKDRFVMGRADYHYQHEPILYGWKEGAAHTWNGNRDKSTLLEFKRPAKSEMHPTMKPVELVAYCLENSSNIKDRILDPFGGSGTTIIAAEQTGRQANLIELDTNYCDTICTRYQQLTGIQPINEETGTEVNFTE